MNSLRKYFLLRPDVVYLNHGAFGACPKPVFEVYQNWQLELEREPVEFLGRRFPELMFNARAALANYLNVRPDDLLWVTNATTGLNWLAHSLPLNPGDEVLATDQEYGAIDRMWKLVCKQRGAFYKREYTHLPVIEPEAFVESLWSKVTERTKVLMVSHITSVTALLLPIAELARRARDTGVWFVVDGAHAPGQIDLDLESLGVDFYAGNCHKWMLAPKGAGFLYVRPELQSLIEPLVVSWEDKSYGESRFIQENEFQGTRDLAAFLSVPAAIDFMQSQDWPEVRKSCCELALAARAKMAEIVGLPPVSPPGDVWLRQMVAQRLPQNLDGERLHQSLFDKHKIEIPVNDVNEQEYIRISVQGYNTKNDIDRFLAAFEQLFNEMTSRRHKFP